MIFSSNLNIIRNNINRIGYIKIIDTTRKHFDLVFLATVTIAFLWIIPINFEYLLGSLLDFRNIGYFIIIFSIIPFFNSFWKEIHKGARLILILFFCYFVLSGGMYYLFKDNFKNMYFAVWMLVTMGSIFYFGGSPNRLLLLFKIVTFSIAFSVLFGILISFIGEPFIGIRYHLIGVDPNAAFEGMGTYGLMRESDLGRVVGLCKSIFAFSYQLAALPVASLSLYLYSTKMKYKVIWGLIFAISIIGILSNAERSAVLSAFLGVLLLAWKIPEYKKKIIIFLAICTIIFIVTSQFQTAHYDQRFILKKRITETSYTENAARFFQQIAAVQTILMNPFGHCGEDYKRIAYGYSSVRAHYGWHITAPHNHYINVGFHTGWAGIFLMVLIFKQIKKCIAVFKAKALLLPGNFVIIYYGIVASFLASMLNACFHNTGLFFAEPATMLLLGLIGAGAGINLKRYR